MLHDELLPMFAAATVKYYKDGNFCFQANHKGIVYAAFIPYMTASEMALCGHVSDDISSSHKGKAGNYKMRYKGKGHFDNAYTIARQRGKVVALDTIKNYKANGAAWRKEHKGMNMGHYFEYRVAAAFNQTWALDVSRGDKKGDFILNGCDWQLKSDGAELMTEEHLKRVM